MKPSSTVLELGYDALSETLVVKFKSGGKYSYHPVNKELYAGLKTADSIGSYLTKKIIKNTDIKMTKLL